MLHGSITSHCICMIQDGMDQAKLRCPRVNMRASKLYAVLFRPPLHVIASWLHGYSLKFWVSNPDVKKDPESQMEVVARMLSALYQDHGDLPMGFCFQQA